MSSLSTGNIVSNVLNKTLTSYPSETLANIIEESPDAKKTPLLAEAAAKFREILKGKSGQMINGTQIQEAFEEVVSLYLVEEPNILEQSETKMIEVVDTLNQSLAKTFESFSLLNRLNLTKFSQLENLYQNLKKPSNAAELAESIENQKKFLVASEEFIDSIDIPANKLLIRVIKPLRDVITQLKIHNESIQEQVVQIDSVAKLMNVTKKLFGGDQKHMKSDMVALSFGIILDEILPDKVKKEMHLARTSGILRTGGQDTWKQIVETRKQLLSLKDEYLKVDQEMSFRFSERDPRIPIFHINQINPNGAVGLLFATSEDSCKVSLLTPYGELEIFDIKAKKITGHQEYLNAATQKLGLVSIPSNGITNFTYDNVQTLTFQVTEGFPAGESNPVNVDRSEKRIDSAILKTLWRKALSPSERFELGLQETGRKFKEVLGRIAR